MRNWHPERVAAAAGANLVEAGGGSVPGGAPPDEEGGAGPGPLGASIDTRGLTPGELFIGLPGSRVDGGAHASEALAAGAWGVLVAPEHAGAAAAEHRGIVLAHADPLAGMQALARAWRAELHARGAKVVAITGSVGKTSTKDILAALLSRAMRTAASPANHNTEIGLPLALLAAPADTEALVLELAMRGSGQIAALTAIAEPDVGVIVNVGPAHLELLGSLEAIAAAKAELIAGLAPGASVVVPAQEPLLEPHLRGDVRTITFGERAGDVSLRERRSDGGVVIALEGEEIVLWPSFRQRHNLLNLLAAVAAARALGHTPGGALEVSFSAMRGQLRELAGGVLVIDDCYNANPMSMRAAIDDLAETAPGRRVAILGDMLELGPQATRLHRELGEHAQASGVGLLVTVGPLAAEMRGGFSGESHALADAHAAAELVPELLRDGDTVLVKGSRGVGLEHVTATLAERRARPAEPGRGAHEGEASALSGRGSGRR
jgi:UDP-N-acetylmuramoyl-tripeptide--D-alanyl-D-alanine ligase